MSRETCVHWLGLSSVYADSERELMSTLPIDEQTILHVLKSLGEGEIQEGSSVRATGSFQEGASCSPAPPVYTNPDDIPFGLPDADKPGKSRKRSIYGLVWTPSKCRQTKTKGKAQAKMKVWKRWYERQGWKVYSVPDGYIALSSTDRHAITLHEYDPETKERRN